MAIQYPKNEHITLPSIEGFNGTLNILRDPPKSVFTKRIDKVQDTDLLTKLIDGSGDRVDGISVYARGVNPMVSVSYDNNSNNAGSYVKGGQSFLPYRIMDKGAFRPPIRTQYDLLPLSRQPRAWFQALTKPEFIDYSKTKYMPTKFRMIKDLLKTEQQIKPNSSVAIDKPIAENYKMQNTINQMHITLKDISSGKKSLDHSNFTRENVDMYKGIQENYESVDAQTNRTSRLSHTLENLSINEKNYIQNRDYYETNANPSIHTNQGLDNLSIDEQNYIGEKDYYETHANPSVYTNQGLDNLSIDEQNYIGEKEYYYFDVNKGRDINVKSIDELNSNNKTSVKHLMQYDTTSGKNTGYTLLTNVPELQLENNMPLLNVDASKNDPTVFRRVSHQNKIELMDNLPKVNGIRNITRIEDMDNFGYASSREYKLDEMLKKGQFLNEGVVPTFDRAVVNVRTDSHKDQIRKFVNQTQFNRF